MTTEVTYDNGVATIIVGGHRKTEINVLLTARLGVGGQLDRVSMTDIRALSAGYLALAGELKLARQELVAARAGGVGPEHAAAMQEVRGLVAEMRAMGEAFLDVCDRGDAPDSKTDSDLRGALFKAERWLVADSTAAIERQKILKGKA
jgi:hypothetical protein